MLEDGNRTTAANRHGLQVSRYDYATSDNGHLSIAKRAADPMAYSEAIGEANSQPIQIRDGIFAGFDDANSSVPGVNSAVNGENIRKGESKYAKPETTGDTASDVSSQFGSQPRENHVTLSSGPSNQSLDVTGRSMQVDDAKPEKHEARQSVKS